MLIRFKTIGWDWPRHAGKNNKDLPVKYCSAIKTKRADQPIKVSAASSVGAECVHQIQMLFIFSFSQKL